MSTVSVNILNNSKKKKREIFRGSQIEINLNDELFKRKKGNKWKKFPLPTHLVIKQLKTVKTEVENAAGVVRKYKTYTVHIKAANEKILAYQGRRSYAVNEANRIAQFLDVEIKDFVPRNSGKSVV